MAIPSTSAAVAPRFHKTPGFATALAAARIAADNQARDVLVLDMTGLTSLFDYFVLATGGSRRQLHAISEEIDRVLENELGETRHNLAGYQECRWIVLDYGHVIVHLFDDAAREYYRLEDLWSAAPRMEVLEGPAPREGAAPFEGSTPQEGAAPQEGSEPQEGPAADEPA